MAILLSASQIGKEVYVTTTSLLLANFMSEDVFIDETAVLEVSL